MHDVFPSLKEFSWQRGYGAFTVSHSNVEEVRRYIARQKEHHQQISFRDEFIQFLKANGIEYDERYDIALNAEPLAVANGCQHSTSANTVLSLSWGFGR